MKTDEKLSKYFYRSEVACKCGCGFDTIDTRTLELADFVRESFGRPITVLSGARCEAHNKAVDGAKHSQHVRGRAIDLMLPRRDALRIYELLCYVFPTKYGFGLYRWGIHIDTKTGPARRWRKDGKEKA